MSDIENASDLFIKALENEGVEFIYGIPGEENLDLLEAIRKSKIQLILGRHEQAAAFMAATYARMTGKVGVAISTLGPGATNFTTAAAYAQLGGFPLLLITGQKPIKKSKQGRFQIIDVVSMMRPITKYTRQIVDVNMVCNTVREAFKIATEERPGAVHIEFPEDVSAEAVTGETKSIFSVAKTAYGEGNVKLIKETAELIKKAKFPIVLIGGGCNRHKISQEMTEFINTTGLPFFNTQMGKGVIDEANKHYIGTSALSAGDYIHDFVERADLIINIGHDAIEKPAYFMNEDEHSNQTVIHINYFSAGTDNIYNPHIEIVGCVSNIVTALAKDVGKCNQDFSYAYKVKDFIHKHIHEHQNDNSFPIKPQKLVNDLNQYAGKDGYLALDNGMYKLWFARNYIAPFSNAILLDNALATMGAGLPSAMELAKLYPERKVVAVVGDGGFMMNSQELETAMRLKLNLVVLILNDSAYGMIRWKQDAMGLKDYGLAFNNPDFVKYAESYGAKGHKLTKTEDLLPLLNKCHAEKGVHVIDLAIDYSENRKVLTEGLQKRAKI